MKEEAPPPARGRATAERLRERLEEGSAIAARIYRNLLILLHTKGCVTIDTIHDEAGRMIEGEGIPRAASDDPNRGLSIRWDSGLRDAVYALVERYTAEHLTPEDVDNAVHQARRAERARTLEEIANVPGVSFQLLADKVREYCALPKEPGYDPLQEESTGVRVALIRHFLSDRLEFIGVAKRHLAVEDMLPIVGNAIGPRAGLGKVGGKAAGMVLAHKIVRRHFEKSGREAPFPLGTPESYYVRSDHFTEFVQRNGLMDYYDIKYKPISEIRRSYPLIREIFKNGQFAPYIMRELRGLLERVGDSPLVIRSSSLLEDNFGSAFSGKYESIFLGNQGRIERRLEQLIGAIAEVYASTLGPDPILYRRERSLIDYDEKMAVLIQKVVGFRHGRYWLPAWAGVAFSQNEWRWSPRIRREEGLARIVLGLGTRAVDRVGDDYPRMVPLGNPTLRPEIGAEEIIRYSQRTVDAINLETNRFERVPLLDLLGDESFPDLHRIVSIAEHGMIAAPASSRFAAKKSSLVVTFDGLLSGPFPSFLREILEVLSAAYNSPIDVEFAFDGRTFFILQARPQAERIQASEVALPEDTPDEQKVFSASRFVPTGKIVDIEYVIYIDPVDYGRVPTAEKKSAIGRLVGRLNDRLEHSRFVLMGPGRWGSNNIDLGVRVRYADIHRTKALIEIARARGGYTPEVSFGTHFFQDLIESGIFYLPLYPDESGNLFNERFFRESPNMLVSLFPEAAEEAEAVRVIHVPSARGGLFLHLYMNTDKQKALAVLGPKV
ncbi:MAG: PEP/pyruvate-binding domain-containing protein [Candidatus Eisenbacteria bacterium]|nr:PEP/pyruvate-binding domain-containing protein [Candidatus Eisenbacteria bacterium]